MSTSFNAKKFYIMSITVNQHTIIPSVTLEETPYFGLNFTESLKWSSHITKITIKKTTTTLNFLRRNLKYFPQECRKTVYISLVRSILDYGQIVWDPNLNQDVERLERVQRQAARFITGDCRTREEGILVKH